jgi:hypothetical protein
MFDVKNILDMIKKIKNKVTFFKKSFSASTFVFLLVLPASTNYKLDDYGFGSGGVSNATSANYSMNAISGETSAGKLSSANYKIGSGLAYVNQAHVPVAPNFSNPNNFYNKLRLSLNTSNNPSDTKFAIAISSNNFVTTQYVKSDNTVGSSLTLADYQTYSTWGGAVGFEVIGLLSNTTYSVKVKAMQGKFTETEFGPIATAATINPTLTFDIDVSATDAKTSPPFSINFGDLTVNTIINSPQKIWVDFSTNGAAGGKVYIIGKNGGLLSTTRSSLISSVSGDLSALAQGFGAQGSTATQTAGGPLSISPAYNQTGNIVAVADSAVREIFTSATPVTGGRASFLLKAKSSSVTPSANDYSETFTVIASGSF